MEKSQKKNKNVIIVIVIFLLVICVILAYIVLKSFSREGSFSVQAESRYNSYEECINRQDITLYINTDNPQNELRKIKLFESLNNFKIKNCFRDSETCKANGVNEYPLWIINGKKVSGEITYSDIQRYTGCS